MPVYQELAVPVADLLFDPNNYRFQDKDDWVLADQGRFGEESVQARAYQRIRPEGVLELKRSILTNGFLPIERLVVKRYDTTGPGTRYLVLEGNRRLAALRWIAEDHRSGVAIPDGVLATLEAVPVVEVPDGDESLYTSVMGIRHVGGIKQWDGYQRAKLVSELRNKHELTSGEVADRLGMTVNEVNRRYRAFAALGQMEDDEEYTHLARPNMYPIFHEAVSIPQIRDWLGWDDGNSKFSNIEELHRFYDLVTEETTEGENGPEKRRRKITSYSQVRELKLILAHQEAMASLLDPEQTWGDALGFAKADDLNRSWRRQVSEATSALEGLSALTLASLKEEELETLKKLSSSLERLLELHAKVSN